MRSYLHGAVCCGGGARGCDGDGGDGDGEGGCGE